jgi:hypothetical protein
MKVYGSNCSTNRICNNVALFVVIVCLVLLRAGVNGALCAGYIVTEQTLRACKRVVVPFSATPAGNSV